MPGVLWLAGSASGPSSDATVPSLAATGPSSAATVFFSSIPSNTSGSSFSTPSHTSASSTLIPSTDVPSPSGHCPPRPPSKASSRMPGVLWLAESASGLSSAALRFLTNGRRSDEYSLHRAHLYHSGHGHDVA
eukprot:GHVU01012381.1.p2 GENE.GHVU01012381.1~~GHVU01012381.1.p2  ORF type:complete len:133 (+),score=9.94 GHVU01012381.1:309-707(+)